MAEAAKADRRTALLGAAAVATGAVAVEATAVRSAVSDGTQGHGLVFRVGGTVEDIAPGDYAPNTAVVIRSAP